MMMNFLMRIISFVRLFLAYKFRQIGPIYYEYGSLIITYDNADIAVKAYYRLREHSVEDKQLLVLLLPNIMPEMIPKGVRVRAGRVFGRVVEDLTISIFCCCCCFR